MAVSKRYKKVNGKKKAVYQAIIYINGERVDYRTFDTKAAAYTWHDEEKAKRLSGADTFEEEENIPFLECVERYKLEALPLLRKSTQETTEARFKYLTDSPIKNILMKDLTDRHIDRWISWLFKHPTTSNPNRVSFQHELKVMSLVLNWYRNELNYRFAIPILKKHRDKCNKRRNRAPRRPDYYIRKEDLGPWLESLEKNALPVYHDLAKFLVLTGLRIGEACGLMWDAVDLGNGTISIIRTLSWELKSKKPYIQEDAKTEEAIRVVRLPSELVVMLKKRKLKSKLGELVFCNTEGGFLRNTRIRDTFKKAFEKSGLSWSGTRITRNTWATLGLIANNGNISAIQANLGHTNRRTTERYARPVRHMFDDVVERTAEFIDLSPIDHSVNHSEGKM